MSFCFFTTLNTASLTILLKLAGLKSIKALVIYLDPIKTKNFENRKDLSNYLENKIRKVYSSALSKKLAK